MIHMTVVFAFFDSPNDLCVCVYACMCVIMHKVDALSV